MMNCGALGDILRASALVLDCHAGDEGSLVFTTEFRHGDGDLIEFALIETPRGLRLSDCGETTSRLFLSGFDTYGQNAAKDRVHLAIARSHGVELVDGEFQIECRGPELSGAITELGTTIARIESSVDSTASRQQTRFSEEVTKLLITNRVRFEYNRQISIDAPKPVTVQYYVEGRDHPKIGFALPGHRRLPQPNLKARLYDFGRIRQSAHLDVVPFLVIPDSVRLDAEQADMLARERVRNYTLPRQQDEFISWLRAA